MKLRGAGSGFTPCSQCWQIVFPRGAVLALRCCRCGTPLHLRRDPTPLEGFGCEASAEPTPGLLGVQSSLEVLVRSSFLAVGAGKRSRVPAPSHSLCSGIAAERGGSIPAPPVGPAAAPSGAGVAPSLGSGWASADTAPQQRRGPAERPRGPRPGGFPVPHRRREGGNPPRRCRGVPAARLSERVLAPTPGANCPGPRPSLLQMQVLRSPPRSPRHRCWLSLVLAQLPGQRQPRVP